MHQYYLYYLEDLLGRLHQHKLLLGLEDPEDLLLLFQLLQLLQLLLLHQFRLHQLLLLRQFRLHLLHLLLH